MTSEASFHPEGSLAAYCAHPWIGADLEVLGSLLLPRVAQLFTETYCVKVRGGPLRFRAQKAGRTLSGGGASVRGELHRVGLLGYVGPIVISGDLPNILGVR